MIPATRSPFLTPVLRICCCDRRSSGQVVLADVGLAVVGDPGRDIGVVREHGDAVVQRTVDGSVEGGVVDQAAPDAVRLAGDGGVERRHHLGDDRARRACPLVRAAGQGAGVLDSVDRRREERVRRHVVDHHELVLRVAGEERVVVVALVGRRARPLLTQDLGQAPVERYACSHYAGVAKETSPRELALFLAHLVMPVCCHSSSFSCLDPVPIEPTCWLRSAGISVGTF